jgi:hypothetical protein
VFFKFFSAYWHSRGIKLSLRGHSALRGVQLQVTVQSSLHFHTAATVQPASFQRKRGVHAVPKATAQSTIPSKRVQTVVPELALDRWASRRLQATRQPYRKPRRKYRFRQGTRKLIFEVTVRLRQIHRVVLVTLRLRQQIRLLIRPSPRTPRLQRLER